MKTMRDVAAKAEVSYTTVSFVLNGRDGEMRIPEDTRQRVLVAATELGYRRNELARAMVSGRNRMLGFLVSFPEAEATARMLAGALDEAEKHNYSLKVLKLNGNRLDRQSIERCLELRLAGVMAIYLDEDSLNFLHEEMARQQIPVAVLERPQRPASGIGVITDDSQAMRLAVGHLAALGHRRIALISEQPSLIFEAREAAFRATMREWKLPIPEGYVSRGQINAPDSRFIEDITRQLLCHPAGRPTAIIGITDPMALVALRVAHESGLQVPQEISFVGYGDLAMATYSYPALTSVELPFREIGGAAVRRLVERVAAPQDQAAPFDELLPARLNVRSSTGPAPREEARQEPS